MLEGWFKTYRKLREWQHYQEPTVVLVWIDLLISANTKDGWYHGQRLRRGEFFTSVATIQEHTGLDAKTIRKALDKLEATGEIKREATNAGSKITINQFIKYQSSGNNPQPNPQHNTQQDTQPNPQPNPQPIPYQQEYIEGKEGKKEKKERIKTAPKERTRYEKIFEEVYQKRTGNPFAWSKRECIAINAIIGKIANMMIAQNKVPTDQDKEAGLRWFLEQLYNTGDAWIISNFVPHIIDAKFNEFYNTIKNGKSNGKQNTNSYGVSEQFLADLARAFAGGV